MSAESVGIGLGLAMALGIFSFKGAVGAYYLCAVPGSGWRKGGILAGALAGDAALFCLAFWVLERVDLWRLAGDWMGFLKAGVLLHVVLCAGLLAWGIRLLARRAGASLGGMEARGWLLLVVPCPVCASAIFLVCAFAGLLFPGSIGLLRWAVPVAFVVSEVLFLGGLQILARWRRLEPLDLTGRLMILIALYFLLILVIAPQFQEAGRLYAVARATAGASPWNGALALAVLAAAAGGIWGLRRHNGD